MVRTKVYNFGRLGEITPEPRRLECSFWHTALLPSALYNLTKFNENSSKGIGVISRTRFRLQTDGQTDARSIAISPEPFGRVIKKLTIICCVLMQYNYDSVFLQKWTIPGKKVRLQNEPERQKTYLRPSLSLIRTFHVCIVDIQGCKTKTDQTARVRGLISSLRWALINVRRYVF